MPSIGICSLCSREREVFTMRKNKGLICAACRSKLYRLDPNNRKFCALCGEFIVPAGIVSGKPVCQNCKKKQRPCLDCGKVGVYRANFCFECFILVKLAPCPSCGLQFINTRLRKICSSCRGKERYERDKAKYKCCFCGKGCQPARRLEGGKVSCGNCRKKFLAVKEQCPDCLEFSYLYKGKIAGHKCCARCNALYAKRKDVKHVKGR